MKINIGEFLTRRAGITPNREALVCEGVRLTYEQLNDRSNRLANHLKELGVGHGDRVGILAFNETEYYDLLFGLGKIGAIMVPVNYRLAGPEIQFILSDCGPKVFIFGREFQEVTDSIRHDIPPQHLISLSNDPPEWAGSYENLIGRASTDEPEIEGGNDDTLTILYTSGTTGRPKGAELTHNYYHWTSIQLTSTVGARDDDITLVALPLFHIGALAAPPWVVHMGAKTILLRTLDPQRFLELLGEEKVTGFGSVPQLLDFLKLVPDFEKYSWDSIRTILVYAAPVPVTLLKEYAASGIEVRQLYGLTESNTATVLDAENALSRVGSCGKPFFHTQLRIVDDNYNDLPPDENGEVLIKAPNVMKGYWNRPEDTAATFKDGWLCTGDIARMDKDGFFYIMDRKKDMIISGGENIYPAEIEDILLGNPKIADVGVIGYTHEKWGEAVKAVVVLNPGEEMTEAELIEWCQGRIGRFKIPKKVVFSEAIPRTPTGKILKTELRKIFN
jgi:fatty-acyl-CoA synthase